MKNIINYYYNIFPDNVYQNNQYFYFYYQNEKYYFYPFERKVEEAKALYALNMEMVKRNILVHEIVLNKDNQILSMVNQIPYILFKVYINERKKTSLSDINYININTMNIINKDNKILERSDWIKLWSEKIDYFEYHINQMGRKYPILSQSLNYFVGMGENAISYIKNTHMDFNINNHDNFLVVCHRKISNDDTLLDVNNPLNFILDYRVRDLSEYIKTNFFYNNNIWDEIHEYFRHNYLSVLEYRLLYGRLLFPSFYFNLYEKIINGLIEEKEIIRIIEKIKDYENFLLEFYSYIKLRVNIPEVDWLAYNKKLSY
jgi:spore coat protein YutH